jgi:hypothetical protein
MRNIPEATFHIAEDENYRYHFVKDGSDVALWKVTVKIETEVFILAEDKEKAINQALCVSEIPSEKREGVQCSADRVPFGIRGWSGNQF